ncbi:MAG: hypothetical protein EAS51_12075 [Microbacteriaceae bacterium]|nr:MAG: hypothetical protein EAS51_12075 [Microbacteriaceae bacterium]
MAPRTRTPARATALVLATAVAAALLPAASASSAPVLGYHVSIAADGTPTWDADDTRAGNGIVRVNDTVTYET